MTDHTIWALGEMTRATVADRLAEAERDRLARSVGAPKRSLRVLLADALRALARTIDEDGASSPGTDRRLARAC